MGQWGTPNMAEISIGDAVGSGFRLVRRRHGSALTWRAPWARASVDLENNPADAF